MAKKFNDPSVTGASTVSDDGRYMWFDGTTGEVFYQTRANLAAQNQGTLNVRFSGDYNQPVTSTNAFGRFTYTGTGGHTLTIGDAATGLIHIFNSGTGDLNLAMTLNSNFLTTVGPGSGRIFWWDGTEYVGIS